MPFLLNRWRENMVIVVYNTWKLPFSTSVWFLPDSEQRTVPRINCFDLNLKLNRMLAGNWFSQFLHASTNNNPWQIYQWSFLISKTGESTTTRGHCIRNRKAARVLYDNYNGNWTAYLHPGILTEMYMYVKNFVISYTIYTSYNQRSHHEVWPEGHISWLG